jgi:mercuric ion binding protein
MRTFFATTALYLLAIPVSAAPKTVILSVPTMDCEVCPITLKKALTKVPGVSQAAINFERRQATVTFDDTRTSVDALTSSATLCSSQSLATVACIVPMGLYRALRFRSTAKAVIAADDWSRPITSLRADFA